MSANATDVAHMHRAIDAAASVRRLTSPNPWVGCVVVSADGHSFDGATGAPGIAAGVARVVVGDDLEIVMEPK